MRLTDEQQAIINSEGSIRVNAYAGTGKTSTLIEYAKNRADKRKYYICFNKSIQTEAEVKFRDAGVKRLKAVTAHAMAYRNTVPDNGYNVSNFGVTPYGVVKMFHLPFERSSFAMGRHIARKFDMFCNSGLDSLDDLDYGITLSESGLAFYEENKEDVDGLTQKIWDDMEAAVIDVSHGFYLKKYQLERPKWAVDTILLDEAQDVNPVMLALVNDQEADKVIVGDTHQQIYGWRGAVNTLESLSYDQFFLSNSFRFHQKIAELGCEALYLKTALDPDFRLGVELKGLGKDTGQVASRAILSRTNASLLRYMFEACYKYDSLYIEGGLDAVTIYENKITLEDLVNFVSGNRSEISSYFLKANFKNVLELEEYIEFSDDNLLGNALRLVQDYGPARIENGLVEIRKKISSEERAQITFSTVHKSKGREWDSVIIADDFSRLPPKLKTTKEGPDGKPIPLDPKEIAAELAVLNEEVNLLYVALTRARLDVSHSFDFIQGGVKASTETDLETNESNDNVAKAVENLLQSGITIEQIKSYLDKRGQK